MFDNRAFSVGTLGVATVIMVLALVAGACGPTPTPENTAREVEVEQRVDEFIQEVTPEVPPEVTPEVPAQVAVEVPLAQVSLMVAATPDELQVWQDQINRFEEETGIRAELRVVPFEEFNAVLLTLIAAGTPPDVAVLSYNHIAQVREYLQPLDGWIAELKFDIEDFLPDAVSSNTIDERLYALPWLRSECLPRYQNLALFQASQNKSDAFRLMDFLTQSAQQKQNYTELQRFPTRLSVYRSLGFLCPPLQAIRPSPAEVSRMISLVEEAWPVLEPVLEGQTINPYEAATEIIKSGTQVTAAPVMRVAPRTEAEFVEAARARDVVIGALFLEGDFGYPPAGDYAVRCRFHPKGQIPCYLVKPDGQEIKVQSKVSFTKAPVGQPFCLAIGGSSVCICFDSRCYCFW